MLVSTDSDSILVSKFEVTNFLYGKFLEENSGKGFEPNDDLWLDVMPYARRYQSDYSSHSRYRDHPVVNISREDAVAFCSWLQERYNSMPKKKYDELKIELPTTEQWEFIARGGLRHAPYPWGGPYARNAKGNWLCNFNPVEERWILDEDTVYIRKDVTQAQIRGAAGQDGYLVTAPVESYSANGYGAFNMSGNVSEMVSDQDFVRGGSWGSLQYYTQVTNFEVYDGASPFIGFRFVAIVQ